MNIDNATKEIREYIDPMTSSAHRFAIIVVVVAVLLALLMFFTARGFFTGIVHWVQLVQALLVCSTALTGLSGLIIIETRKTNVTGLSSEDMVEKIKAINTITSLAKAHVVLRWSVLLSIFTITFSVLCLMMNNPVCLLVCSITAFLTQFYLFILGSLFSDLLPS